MKESLRQLQQQKLQQKLNPQQVRFGRLLEMSTPEIEDEVRRELDENPALEEVVPETEHGNDDFNETAEQLQMADYGSDDDIPSYRLEARNASADDPHLEPLAISEDEESMMAVLLQRLSESDLGDTDMRIAEYIIGNLDSNGYITRSMAAIADDIAVAEGFDPGEDRVRRVFRAVRALEPAGIGAVDLRDCLLLQIDRMPSSLTVRIAREIIADNFDLFSKKHFDRLRGVLGVDPEEFQNALDLIRTLNPKPGAILENNGAGDRLRHIVPDFAVDYDPESRRFTVSLLNRTPELSVESSFAADDTLAPERTSSSSQQITEARSFIRRKRDEAQSFIRLLEMRSRTLLSVMEAITAFQTAFFISGDRADIRPMILRDIASATGHDISVVSRAATGKYVLTPHGLYPLKMFFNERPKSDNDTSSHEIFQTITDLIASEDKRHPLSDESIKDILASKGFDIARRTVAKYRERLGLPVARLRKQF